MRTRKILITGSSGQAGRAIANLLSPDYEVIGMDKVPGPFTSQLADLSDWNCVKEITKGVAAIIHTASLHAPHVSTHSREHFVDTNIKGTLYLLEAAKANQVGKLVYTSTTSPYGERLHDPTSAGWITEEVSPIARDIYDITKLTAEALCKDFFDAEKLQTLSLRVSRFWDEPLPSKVFYRMYRSVDIRDVAQAHQLAMQASFDQFEVFNISAQTIFELTDVVQLKHHLVELLERRFPEIITLFHRQGWQLPDSIDRVYVIQKAKERLHFQPQYNIQELMCELSPKNS